MAKRSTFVLAMLVACGLSLPQAAEASGSSILLTGSRTGWTDITLSGQVSLDASSAVMTSHGRFAGFYIQPESANGKAIGRVLLRDYHGDGDSASPEVLAAPDAPLEAGRYRVYLIADGQTTVRISISGMNGLRLAPKHFVRAASAVQILSVTADSVSGRQPLVASKHSVSLSSLLLEKTQAFVGTLGVCLTNPGGSCDNAGQDGSRAGWFVDPQGAPDFGWTVIYAAGVKSGHFDAVQTATNVAGIKGAVGASFTLELV